MIQDRSSLGIETAETTLQAAGIPAHNVATSDGVLADSQLQFLGHFIELDHPLHGKTVVELTPARTTRVAPTVGRDKDFILREILHYNDAVGTDFGSDKEHSTS